jgi:hypothetical protein
MNIQEQLKSGKYNLSWVAEQLYGSRSKSSVAKLTNKLHNVQNRSFTEDEEKKIKKILK